MKVRNYKKPTLRKFTEIAEKAGGNISSIAKAFKVNRKTVYEWAKEDTDFQDVIDDQRGRILDECIATSRVLARGIPILDENKKIVGWEERPDGQMVRYLMSTLGRKEGFGENIDVTTAGSPLSQGITIEVIDKREQVRTDDNTDN
jgi:hypothetical protein|nr:MAG TPA: putative terminase small subunit [Caudoviricetes sp.]DAY02603.1 MAG TPA: putative terminase small subunit [Caudoviricetes sp.]